MQPPQELHDVLKVIPSAILDVRYASPNNFTGKQLYEEQLIWLRLEPLEKLKLAAEELAANGFRLVLFDAFRPLSVQQKLRSVVDDNNYVAEVSNHCRGITVDLSLAYANGIYLDMGTDYDDFTDKAHSNNKLVNRDQAMNRVLLKDALENQGFVQHQFEWWHFDYQPDGNWSLIEDETNAYSGEKW